MFPSKIRFVQHGDSENHGDRGDGNGNYNGNFLGLTTVRHADSAWRTLFPQVVAVSVNSVALRDSVLKKREPY